MATIEISSKPFPFSYEEGMVKNSQGAEVHVDELMNYNFGAEEVMEFLGGLCSDDYPEGFFPDLSQAEDGWTESHTFTIDRDNYTMTIATVFRF